MKPYATKFYKSQAWKRCRERYAASVGGLCERCRANGRIVPGEIVHHKIHITPENIREPSITLDWHNLELLCRDCHAKEHGTVVKRFSVNEFGEVKILE